MTDAEGKKNRLVAAITVAAVILIAIFIAVIIYQMVELVVINNRKKELEAQITELQEQIESSQNDLDYLYSEEFLHEYLMDYGYVDDGN